MAYRGQKIEISLYTPKTGYICDIFQIYFRTFVAKLRNSMNNIHFYTLIGNGGMRLEVTNYGAKLTRWLVSDAMGIVE